MSMDLRKLGTNHGTGSEINSTHLHGCEIWSPARKRERGNEY